jgi:hypothetical protein
MRKSFAPLKKLFNVYTDDDQGIGTAVVQQVMAENVNNSLILVTSSEIVVFTPGQVRQEFSFRLNIAGFFEMAAISHLGPAFGVSCEAPR